MRIPWRRAKRSAWQVSFHDDFTNLSNWWLYSGTPGGDPHALWSPKNVSVSNSIVNLSTRMGTLANGQPGWVSSGIGCNYSQLYGKYEVRMRADNSPGVSLIALLWPAVEQWPPEIDFYEDSGDRNSFAATLHYKPGNQTIQKSITHYDFTQWHTVGVEWTPGKLVYTIDGIVWDTVSNTNVPSIPMRLDIQTQYLGSGDAVPCAAQIDWVTIYKAA